MNSSNLSANKEADMARSSKNASTFEQLTRYPLRVLTAFGGSELAEKFGLRAPAERVLYEGARASMRAANAGAAVARRVTSSKATKGHRLEPAKPKGLFDLTLTEEQTMVRDTMRRFAEEVLRPAARVAEDTRVPSEEVLAQSHELGLATLAVPEALGGVATELSATTFTIIAEELSRGDMGLALAVLSPIAVVNALVTWGTAEQQAQYLPSFLGDRFFPAALALLEPEPRFDPSRPRAGAVRDHRGGFRLYGEKSLVALAETAELFLVVAEVRGLGPRIFVVPRGAEGLTVTADPAMGLRGAGLGRIRLDNVHVPENAVLGGEGLDGFDVGVLVDRARIAWGAMAVGTAQAVLDYVIPYCNSRQAFGEPITNRQAVAFLIADVAIELEGMRLLVQRAASLSDAGEDVAKEASLARIQCSSKGMKIGSDGVQLLGGHGFVREHPVERWYRDLRAIGVVEGALLA